MGKELLPTGFFEGIDFIVPVPLALFNDFIHRAIPYNTSGANETMHCKIFDEPRNVIESVANLCEMKNIRENSLCCGAGGGVKSAYPEITNQMVESRINQAKTTNCKTLTAKIGRASCRERV